MKKTSKKALALSKTTIKQLAGADLRGAAGGLRNTLGVNLTCVSCIQVGCAPTLAVPCKSGDPFSCVPV